MRIFLILCLLFLSGCYSPLYMNDPYKPTNPENIVMRGRFENNLGWLIGKAGRGNDDIGVACPNSEQIAYIRDFGIGPLFFVNEQMAIDRARKQAASLGGDGASVYNLYSMWWILFTTTHARSIVYKCNVSSGKRMVSTKPEVQQPVVQKPEVKKSVVQKREVQKPEMKKTEVKNPEVKRPAPNIGKKKIKNGNEVMYIPESYIR